MEQCFNFWQECPLVLLILQLSHLLGLRLIYLNPTNASVATKIDDSFLANLQGNTAENCHVINLFDLHRSIWLLRSCCVDLVLLYLRNTCFFPRFETRQHLALYTLHKTQEIKYLQGGLWTRSQNTSTLDVILNLNNFMTKIYVIRATYYFSRPVK